MSDCHDSGHHRVYEHKNSAIPASMEDSFMTIDSDGLVSVLNLSAELLTGWTQKDAVGRPAEEVFPVLAEHSGKVMSIPGKGSFPQGMTQILLNRGVLQSRNGREHMIAGIFSPIRVRGVDEAIGTVVVFRDISVHRSGVTGMERTRREFEMSRISGEGTREYAENIINTVRDPLIVLNQDLRVLTASRSFYEVFKVKPEETVGVLIYDLGNGQWNIPQLRELLETILVRMTTFDNFHVQHDFSNIGRRTMLLNGRLIKQTSGKERIILLAIEDITERREIERGLEQAHLELTGLITELRRTARVKSEFLANMSHEMRTPLNSINGILDMAKVEAERMQLSLSVLPTKNLVREITALVADIASRKNLRMIVEIAPDLPDIEADEIKVKEILYNLLSNAIKFTPEGGIFGIRAKKTGTMVDIEIRDKGIGIEAVHMNNIFEGFVRVDTPYSRETEGTGLGLPLSRKLVELHGGELTVVSRGLGKGTSVRFTLPINSGKRVTE